jgi:hypothetical protein
VCMRSRTCDYSQSKTGPATRAATGTGTRERRGRSKRVRRQVRSLPIIVSSFELEFPSSPCCFRRWLAMPPLRPASRASSDVHSCAVPFWCAALPPLLAISRCLLRSIDANPRSSFAT